MQLINKDKTKKATTLASNPKTGDSITIWFGLMVASMMGIIGTVRLNKKSK